MNTKKLNILYLTARFPFPVIGGDRLKPYHILSHLSKKHNVTLVTFYHGGEPPKSYVKEVENLGLELHTIPLNPLNAGIKTFFKLPAGFPLEIDFYWNTEYKKTVNKLIQSRNFDLGIAFFMRTAEYIKNAKFKKILMAEDCRALYQKRSSDRSNHLIQKIVRRWEYHKLKKYEPAIMNHFDIVTFVTKNDINELQKSNPDVAYRLLTNGVDINKFIAPEDTSIRNGILFAGKLDVWANILMVQLLLKEIFPKVREQVPDAELHIVGASPAPTLLNLLKNNEAVYLHSDVPEMIPYLQSAQLFLHPHNGGSGIQNKLLEAMACGCPVVTTSTGIQGIEAKNGNEVMLGETPDELASHAIEIMTDKSLAEIISQNARNMIVRTHSWELIFDAMDGIIEELFPVENLIIE